MLPSSLLALTASLLVSLTTASSPVCVPSENGYQAEKLTFLYNDFCNQLVSSNFGSQVKLYDLPIVSLSFTSANTASPCDLNNCLQSYTTLADACKSRNRSFSRCVC